mgnify:CR=1 FL=1
MTIEAAYEGPAVELSLVVPVPGPIGRENVRTVSGTAFRRLDQRLDDGAIVAGAIECLLDGDHIGIARRLQFSLFQQGGSGLQLGHPEQRQCHYESH